MLIAELSVKIGLTKLYSSLTILKELIASISAIISQFFLISNTLVFTVSFISLNKLYSNSIILSSAFKISASFSFNSGEINLSALVKVCFLSQPYSSLTCLL